MLFYMFLLIVDGDGEVLFFDECLFDYVVVWFVCVW